MDNPQGRLKRYSRSLFLLLPLTAMILTLLLMEVSLQVFFPDLNIQIIQRTEFPRGSDRFNALHGRYVTISGEPGYYHDPNHPDYNSVSIIGCDTPLPTPPGQFRILFLGDSVTEWRAASKENWCQSVVRGLNQPGKFPEFVALNAGHDGYGLIQETAWLERFGTQTDFQAIVLGLVNNDLSRSPERIESKTGIEFIYRATAPVPLLIDPGSWKEFLFNRLVLPSGIFRGLQWCRQKLGIPGKPDWYLPDQAAALAALEAIQQWSRQRNLPLVIVHFPVYWEPGQHYDELPESAIHRLVSARARELDIPYLDLLPAFQSADPSTLFLSEEIHSKARAYHPNAHGHQLAAATVIPFLQSILDQPLPSGTPGTMNAYIPGATPDLWAVDPEEDVIPPEELRIHDIAPGFPGKIRIHRYRDLYPDGLPHTAWLCDTLEIIQQDAKITLSPGAHHFHPNGSLALIRQDDPAPDCNRVMPALEPTQPDPEITEQLVDRLGPLEFYIPWVTRVKQDPGGNLFFRSVEGLARLNDHLYQYAANTWYPLTAPGKDLGFWQDTAEVFHPADISASIPPESTTPEGQTRSVVIAGRAVEFILVPAGSFIMGAPGNLETRPHKVTISRPYYLARHEVTRGIWQRVMGMEPGTPRADSMDLPITGVSWSDCQSFLTRLNGSGTAKFRLPTEAEWEYAARAGTQTFYPWGDEMNPEACWFIDNSQGDPHVTGSRSPNRWGFHDMIGNVWEWCADYYDADYYAHSPQVDPPGPARGNFRVYRGGSWASGLRYCHVALRSYNSEDYSSHRVGLRIILDQ